MKRTSRKPSFFWQGLLILAPLLVLAKLGALALSQDKRMARHEAELRAQDIAEQTAEVIWTELQKPTNAWPLRTDRDGALLHPRPYDRTLHPQPLDLATLSEQQRGWWSTGQTALGRVLHRPTGNDFEVVQQGVSALESFLASNPPTNFAVAAHFIAGRLLFREPLGMQWDGAKHFLAIISNYPAALTESGLPALPLAHFRLHEVARSVLGNAHAASNAFAAVLENPNLLTGELLKQLFPDTNVSFDWSRDQDPPSKESRLRIDRGRQSIFAIRSNAFQTWHEHERLRDIHTAITPAMRLETNAPSLFWLTLPGDATSSPGSANTNGQRWLLVQLPQENGATVLCRTEAWVNEMIASALKRVRMPEHLDASVYLAGIGVVPSNRLDMIEQVSGGKGSGQYWRRTHAVESPAVLGFAARGHSPVPVPTLTTIPPAWLASRSAAGQAVVVGVHLISPELLYAQQEERATWFRLLIGASAIASIIGFFAAWHAFRKQLRLAEMKSNFVSSVSHELRAPIASVRLMAEGLERGKISDPAKQHEYYRFITQECRRLSSMIENVLDFARIEQGRKEYEFEPTDVGALVEQTVKVMQPYAAERGVGLVANVPPASRRERTSENPEPLGESSYAGNPQALTRQDAGGTLVADIDGQALQQALVNLLDNAIKHSPAGSEVRVDLRVGSGARGDGGTTENGPSMLLALSVSDDGPGIPASEQEKIFERFYRLGSELRRETPGVGIGLSIVKHIVEAHGGRVRVQSEVGHGSCFTIELPLNVPPASRRDPEPDGALTRRDAGGTL